MQQVFAKVSSPKPMQTPHFAITVYLVGATSSASAVQVDTLLAGSGLASKAAMIRNGAQLLWQDLQPLLAAARQQGLCPADMFSKADIYW
jgi:hypothetical protein